MSSAVEYTRSWFSLGAWVNSATKGAFNLAVERDADTGRLVNTMPTTFPNLLKPNHYDWALPADEPNQLDAQIQSAKRSQLPASILSTQPSLLRGHQTPAISK